MKFAIVSVALFVAAAVGQTLQINTPANVVECQPTLLTWSGGTPPYFLSILPGNSPGSPALQDLGQQTGTSLTWTANIAAGTSIGLTLRDSTGAIAQSAAFTINPGASSACVTSSGSSNVADSSSVSASAASSSGAVTTPAATTPAASSPATSASSTRPVTSTTGTSRTGTATGAAAATSSGAAKANVANMGVAGVIGAAVMAILA